MNPTLRRAFGAVAAGVALTGSIAISPLAAGAETSTESVAASATAVRTDAENGRVVEAMYQGFLKREPTTAEMTAGKILAADGDLDGLVSLVSRGDEWLGVFVDDLYDQALERTPDAEGRTYWIGELADGKASTLIAASVIGSPEFRTLSGGTDEGFIERNYVRILERASEPEGKAFWLSILDANDDAKIGSEFFESQENRNRRVTNQYAQLLCRTPDTEGRDYWAGVIQGGRDVALSEFLATSDEFINNAVAGECLTEIDPVDPVDETPVPAEVCEGVAGMPSDDCEALVTIYNENGGENWKAAYRDSWTADNVACDWEGVTCLGGKLTQLALNDIGITGDVDDALTGLTDLTHFNLSSNEITSFPAGMEALVNVRFVNVSYNDLTSLGGLDSAQDVEVFEATHTGLSDAEIDISTLGAAGDGLRIVRVNTNVSPTNTDGAPNTLTVLPLPTDRSSLTEIQAQFNQLTDISGVEDATALEMLWLFNNRIGTIPTGISALTALADDTAAPGDGSNDALRFGPQCPATNADGSDTAFLDSKDASWDDAGVVDEGLCKNAS